MKTYNTPIGLAAALLAFTSIANAQNFDFGAAAPIQDGSVLPGFGTSLAISSNSGFNNGIDPHDRNQWNFGDGGVGWLRLGYSYGTFGELVPAPEDRDLTLSFSNPVTFSNGGFSIFDFGRADFTITSDVGMSFTGGGLLEVTDMPGIHGYQVASSPDGKTLTFTDIDGSTHGSFDPFFIALDGPVSWITLTLSESAIGNGSGGDWGSFLFAEHTAVPEPSGALLVGLAGSLALLRRRRNA